MSTKAIQLIVGLGNPGAEYHGTRHNAGADFVTALADIHGLTFKKDNKFHGLHARLQSQGSNCHLFIPTTYMNNSGQALRAIMQFYRIEPEAILVAHDDLDLPVGTLRIRPTGGHGGHNGLRDIIAQLQTKTFYRLRIGIGHPGHKDKVTRYVLEKPKKNEQEQLEDAIQKALHSAPELLNGEIQSAMQILHTQIKEEVPNGI